MCRGFVEFGIDLRCNGIHRRRSGILLRSGTGYIHTDRHGRCARFGEVLELFDRELCQRVKLQRGVECKHTVHQRRLAGGNIIFPRLLLPRRVLRQRLRQNGGLCFARLQHVVHGAGQLTLELFRAGGVLVLHRDHDGRGNAVEIAVSHEAAHDGIHRHIELRALEIRAAAHIRKDSFRVLVERRADEDLFTSIHLQLNAGVHIQRHHGRNRVHLLVEQSAAEQHHRKAGGNERCPSSLRRFLCCHGNYRSFPLFAAGENAVHIIRRGLFDRRGQMALHLLVGHRASSPSRKLCIFFNAL